MVQLYVSVFGYAQCTGAVKLVAKERYDSKYFLLKIINESIFQSLTPNKSGCQQLITIQNLDPAANRKPQ